MYARPGMNASCRARLAGTELMIRSTQDRHMESGSSRADLSSLVKPEEKTLFAVSAVIGALVYVLIVYLAATSPVARPTIIMYGVFFAVFSIVLHGFMIGRIRGNGVRVSATQFPAVHSLVQRHAATLGMSESPAVYVLQAGGVLNAFATRFFGRNFVILYSDVLAMAERRGAEAVSFVVAHELAHLKRGHLKYRWLLAPSRIVPFLSGAYSRACEYTCDRFGALCVPEGAIPGLLALAAGGELHDQVDPRQFAAQSETESGFWFGVSEVFASHPHLTNRVGALLAARGAVPAYSPMQVGRSEMVST
jgi:Zn-dependent protease with chaperone function